MGHFQVDNGQVKIFRSPPTLCGGGDLLFLPCPPAAAICSCSHSKKKTLGIYFQIFAVCILALGNLPDNLFFLRFSVSSTKSQERPYPGRELKAFGVILIIKTLLFLRFSILADFSVLHILAIIEIW